MISIPVIPEYGRGSRYVSINPTQVASVEDERYHRKIRMSNGDTYYTTWDKWELERSIRQGS